MRRPLYSRSRLSSHARLAARSPRLGARLRRSSPQPAAPPPLLRRTFNAASRAASSAASIALLASIIAASSPLRAQECDSAPPVGVEYNFENIAPDASVVYVKQDCDTQPGEIDNCFESMRKLSDERDGWIWRVRNPSAAAPLVVKIGPGSFGTFTCPARRWQDDYRSQIFANAGLFETQDLEAWAAAEPAGHVSLQGSGRGISILEDFPTNPTNEEGEAEGQLSSGFFAHDCVEIAVSDLTVRGSRYGAAWAGGGSSTWTDVDMDLYPDRGSVNSAWFGQCDSQTNQADTWDGCVDPIPPYVNGRDRPVHFYHGVRVRGFGGLSGQFGAAFVEDCGENWFYGGEISFHIQSPIMTGLFLNAGILLREHSNHASGDFRGFGTKISVIADVPPLARSRLVGVRVEEADSTHDDDGNPDKRSQFHLHGGLLEVKNRSGSNNRVVGIEVDQIDPTAPAGQGAAFAHTVESAFDLATTGDGPIIRLSQTRGGIVLAPFMWPPRTQPPQSATYPLFSIDGQDLYVETDCDPTGDCDAGGNQSQLMVFDDSCGDGTLESGGPWRSASTGHCRP